MPGTGSTFWETSVTAVRLVAVDMDGTFLDDSMGYDRARFAAVHAHLAALGVRFVVASGNQYHQLRSFFPDHPDVLFVAENGALIADWSGNELRVQPIDRGIAATTWRTLEGWQDVHVIVCGRRAAYVRDDADHEAVALTRRYYHRLDHVGSFDEISDDVVKFALICPPSRTDEILVALAAALPADTIVPTSSGHGSIDLIARGVNKGTALAWLGRHLGIPTEAMIAFGDGGNDVEMLRTVGLGVAMAQAPVTVRAHADLVTASNNESGVLTYLERALPAWQRAAYPPGDPVATRDAEARSSTPAQRQ